MAALKLLLGCFLLLNVPCLYLAAPGPPIYLGRSYKAIGEIVESLSEPMEGTTMQLAFEEHFDNTSGSSVFTVWETGINITYVEDGLTGQTFKYFQGQTCTLEDKSDWLKIGTSLPGYGFSNGRIMFSLRQLFLIDSSKLVDSESNKATQIRGIPATSWQYKFTDKADGKVTEATVTAYFSNEGWSTTSDIGVRVPLGFKMEKVVVNENGEPVDSSNMYISVFAFLLDVVDKKAFAPKENIYCEGREHPLAFPKFPKWQAFSMRSEIVLPDGQEMKNMDVYFDSLNRMLRVDLDRMDNQEIEGDIVTSRKLTSQITSKDLGATFKIELYRRKATCTASKLSEYNFDMQEIVNPKLDNKLWSLEYILGSNTTNYTYVGTTTKRNFPCHLFQGIRKDWPDPSSKVTSLWEWCISTDFPDETKSIRFRDGELGIISAYVNVTESANPNIMVGYRMIHHFYDVVKEDPHALSLTKFDISRLCFRDDSQKKRLQFVVNTTITDDNIHILENATSDTTFLRLWRNSIADATKLLVPYMRISKVQASIFGKQVIVTFNLLGIHESLPEEAKKGQPTLDEAYKSLKSAIDGEGLTISYFPSAKAKAMPMAAVVDSLADTVDVVVDTRTSPNIPVITTTPTSEGTLPFITLVSETTTGTGSTPLKETTVTGSSSTVESSSTTTRKPTDEHQGPTEGHGPGTVAGLSIGLLLVGIAGGAGGTYVKFKGLPW